MPCEERKRRPVQPDALRGEPGPARVAELQSLQINRSRKGAREPRDAHVAGSHAGRDVLKPDSAAYGIAGYQERSHERPDREHHSAYNPGGNAQAATHQNASPRPM